MGIYKKLGPAGAFNDVTKGSNPGCDTQGFPAAKGWDPVTGWGTPDFGKIRDMVLATPVKEEGRRKRCHTSQGSCPLVYMCRLIKENGRAYRSSVREAREHRLSDAFVKRHAVRSQ